MWWCSLLPSGRVISRGPRSRWMGAGSRELDFYHTIACDIASGLAVTVTDPHGGLYGFRFGATGGRLVPHPARRWSLTRREKMRRLHERHALQCVAAHARFDNL